MPSLPMSVVTHPRASDQRQLTARLTRSGESLYAAVKQAVRAVEDEFLTSALGAEGAARLRRLLAQLAAESSAEGAD